MKKIISIILTLVMALAMVPMAYADEITFTDVPEDAEYAEAVNYCVKKKLMAGTGDNKFSPGVNVTRAMAVTILYRQQHPEGLEDSNPGVSEDSNQFIDIKKDDWYYKSVLWAVSKGLVKGYNEKEFRPVNELKFGEILTILWRFAEKNSEDDEETVKNWAKNQGIFKDDDNWDGEVKRYKLAMLIYTYFEENNSKPSSTGEAVATVTPAPETTNAPEVTATTTPVATGAPVTTENPKSEIGDDNYTTYSDAYKDKDGNIQSLRDTLGGGKTYSVNQVGDTLFYIDNDFQISTAKITDTSTTSKVKDENDNEITAILIKVIGNNIYGIKTEQPGVLIGELFKATIDNNNIIHDYKRMAGNANSFKIKNNYCYFIDTTDNKYTLNRIKIDDDSATVQGVYYLDKTTQLDKVDYYNITDNNYMLYYVFDSKKLRLAKLYEEEGIILVEDIKEYEDPSIDNMHYINVDYNNNKFYGIIDNTQDNSILEVDPVEMKLETVFSAPKIRNISIFDGKIYARVNNEFQEIKINQ